MSWIENNRRYLMAEIERVRAHIADPTDTKPVTPFEEPPPMLVVLQRLFRLSPFERDVIVMCIAAALEQSALLRPTFSLALAMLADAHFDATSPQSPLRAHRLLTLAPAASVLVAPLAIDDRVLHFVLGIDAIDERLVPIQIATHSAPLAPVPSQGPSVERLVAVLSPSAQSVAIQLVGGSAQDRLAVLDRAVARVGLRPLRLRASALQQSAADLDVLVRVCERERVFARALPIVEIDPVDGAEVKRATALFADRMLGPVVLASGGEPLVLARTSLHVELGWPTTAERRALWTDALGADAPRLGDALDRIAEQFRIDQNTIAGALLACDRRGDDDTLRRTLWTACVERSRLPFDELASRIVPRATWNDLVLPPGVTTTLRDIGKHLAFRAAVHERWRFAPGDSRGQAITALFCGPSGTGKTFAAEVIAHDTQLDLYHIDLSQVVDKYVGETEKRLSRIFDAAERGGAILLFDEADALFGKRGEIERGTDRWANLEVSYLLQRMERYRGLAILTTNAKDAIDSAFLRRLRFIVRFQYPDVPLRTELWRRAFPSEAPTSGLEHGLLARLQLTGANIKSVALSSAVYAASEQQPISMAHVIRAARAEFVKLDQPFPEAELRTWTTRHVDVPVTG